MLQNLVRPSLRQNIWPNQLTYSLSMPKAVAFGTSIPILARLTPLAEGLKLKQVQFELLEGVELRNQDPGRRKGV